MINNIFKEFFSFSLANIFYRLVFPIISIILALNFSPNKYGAWSVYISIIPLITIILDFGLSKTLARFYFDYSNENEQIRSKFLKEFVFLRVITFFILLLLVIIFLNLYWSVLSKNYFDKSPFLFLMVIYGISEAQILLILSFLRVAFFSWIYFCIRLSQFILTIFFTLFLSSYYGITGAIIGLTIATFLLSVIITFYYISYYYGRIKKSATNKNLSIYQNLIRYASPLLINDTTWWLRNTCMPIILTIFLPLSIAGDYHIALILASALGMLMWSIDITLVPYYYKFRNDNNNKETVDKNLKVYSNLIIAAVSAVTIIFSIISTSFIELVFPERMNTTGKVLPILILSYYFQAFYILWIKPCLYNKKNTLIPLISIIVTIVTLLSYFYLTPLYGIVSTAIVNASSFLLMAIGAIIYSRYVDKTGLQFLIYVPSILLVTTAIFFNYLLVNNETSILEFLIITFISVMVIISTLLMPHYKFLKQYVRQIS